MSSTVEALIHLRNRTMDDYVNGRTPPPAAASYAPDPAATTIVAMTVGSLPAPYVPSSQHLSCTCGEPISLASGDPAMEALLAGGARTVCLPCASASGLSADRPMVTSRNAIQRAARACGRPAKVDA